MTDYDLLQKFRQLPERQQDGAFAIWYAFLFALCVLSQRIDAAEALFYSAFVSAGLGAAVTLFQGLTQQPFRGAVFAVFVAASYIGASASYRTSKESDKASAETKKRVEGIDKIVADVHRRSEEISALNRKTLEAASEIIDVERQIKATAGESLKNITGGDSFVYVEPLVHAVLSDGRIPLRVVNNGRYPITGAVIQFRRVPHPLDDKFQENLAMPYKSSPLTVPPGTSIPLAEAISPGIVPGFDVDGYVFLITSSNGTIHQSLFFRKDEHWASKMHGFWQFRTHVARERPLVRAPGRAHVTSSAPQQTLLQTGWLGAQWSESPKKP